MVHIAREGMIPAMLESERRGKEGGAWHMAHALCASEWPAPIHLGWNQGGGGQARQTWSYKAHSTGGGARSKNQAWIQTTRSEVWERVGLAYCGTISMKATEAA